MVPVRMSTLGVASIWSTRYDDIEVRNDRGLA